MQLTEIEFASQRILQARNIVVAQIEDVGTPSTP